MHSKNSAQIFCSLCGASCQLVLTGLFDGRFGAPGLVDIVRCPQCGLEQTAPQPTKDQLKDLYENFYNFGGETDTAYTRIREWFLASTLYRQWLKWDGDISFHLRQGTGRLLDVGCNEGRTLSLYARNGFQVEGLELNEVAAAAARLRGFKVSTTPLEEFESDFPYDVVVLSNVLEHALDPLEMLQHVRRLLRPEGQVWISCPNAASYWRQFFGRHWVNWHVPFHLWHFSPNTIKKILDLSQFRVLTLSTFTPAHWLALSLCSKVGSQAEKANRLMRSPVVMASMMLVFRVFLSTKLTTYNNRLKGDCLLVTAQVTHK